MSFTSVPLVLSWGVSRKSARPYWISSDLSSQSWGVIVRRAANVTRASRRCLRHNFWTSCAICVCECNLFLLWISWRTGTCRPRKRTEGACTEVQCLNRLTTETLDRRGEITSDYRNYRRYWTLYGGSSCVSFVTSPYELMQQRLLRIFLICFVHKILTIFKEIQNKSLFALQICCVMSAIDW